MKTPAFDILDQGDGGKRWQEWLSRGPGPYAEIHAGLAQPQFEHLAKPAGAEWSWVEAYGNAKLYLQLPTASAWFEEFVPDVELENALAEASGKHAPPRM